MTDAILLVPSDGGRVCSVEGCGRKHLAMGFCNRHYIRLRKKGDPMAVPRFDVMGRFLSFVHKTEGCWLWTGSVSGGYGRFCVNDRPVSAHRFSYEAYVGPIPDEMEVDHLCFVKNCVNPNHLEAVTPAVNSQRAVARYPRPLRLTDACRRGHDLTTTGAIRTVSGDRRCAECYRAGRDRRNAKRRLVLLGSDGREVTP